MSEPTDKMQEVIMNVRLRFSQDPAKQPERQRAQSWIDQQAEARIADATAEFADDPNVDLTSVEVYLPF